MVAVLRSIGYVCCGHRMVQGESMCLMFSDPELGKVFRFTEEVNEPLWGKANCSEPSGSWVGMRGAFFSWILFPSSFYHSHLRLATGTFSRAILNGDPHSTQRGISVLPRQSISFFLDLHSGLSMAPLEDRDFRFWYQPALPWAVVRVILCAAGKIISKSQWLKQYDRLK